MSTATTVERAAEALSDPEKKKGWLTGGLNLAFHSAVGLGAGVAAGLLLNAPMVGLLATAFGAAASARFLEKHDLGQKSFNFVRGLFSKPS